MDNADSKWHRLSPYYLQQRLKQRVELQRILANTGWLFLDKAIQIITMLFVGVWVARYLGPDQRGIMIYAVALVSLFIPFSALGIGGILVRELVRVPEEKGELMGTAFVLQIVGYLLFLPIIIGSIMYLRPGETTVQWAVIIVAFGYIFAASRVIQHWFRSQLQSKYTVWATRSVGIIIAGIKIYLIVISATLIAFIFVTALEVFLVALGLLFFYIRTGESVRHWHFNAGRAKELLRDGWPLAFSLLATTIFLKIDSVMLGQMLDDRAVGIYGEAARLSQLWYFIPTAITISTYPALVRAFDTFSPVQYRKRVQQLFDILTGIAYLLAIPAALIAPYIVNFLYGSDYDGTGGVLAIHIWAFVFVSLRYGMDRWLMVENKTKFIMWSAVIGAIVNICLNLLLVPLYGIYGAAWATVIASAASIFLVSMLSAQLHTLFRQMVLAMLIPFRIQTYLK